MASVGRPKGSGKNTSKTASKSTGKQSTTKSKPVVEEEPISIASLPQTVNLAVDNPAQFKPLLVKNRDLELVQLAKTYKCCACGESTDNQGELFSTCASSVYAGYNYYLPICNKCLEKLFEMLMTNVSNYRAVYRRICMMFDIYYTDALADSAFEASWVKRRVSSYLNKLSLNANNKSRTYANTLYEDGLVYKQEQDKIKSYEDEIEQLKEQQAQTQATSTQPAEAKVLREEPDEFVITAEMIDFWGEGFEATDYAFLQKHYDKWIVSCPDSDYGAQVLLKQAAFTEWNLLRANVKGDALEINKMTTQLNTLITSLNLKPAQKNAEDLFSTTQTFGSLIKKFEETRPIPEKEPSGLAKYITVWFFGHLCKLLNLKNPWAEDCEKEIAKYTVKPPSFEDDVAPTASFDDIFGGGM